MSTKKISTSFVAYILCINIVDYYYSVGERSSVMSVSVSLSVCLSVYVNV